ncbi:aldehyde dehydrogenase family protein [Bosea sp. (in: a-proteobacteria)]|uniref:aldehyde dehydrogenase family protein n=1 Tax=Bosea sp. (in: a-proteobacteria) TaxID=1871050 RepID=UPI0011F5C19A|nr:aldehyde dehydrogenase family protein [Bosea sp. (in: a-proteobacteria)]TAJ30391.1 MAG: aldehyde dehydrogenase family protein [Bosea sp. (in: a-proteobacteria)]
MHRFDQVYIGGEFRTAHGREELGLVNPATEEPLGVLVMADEDDARQAVDSARIAFKGWSRSCRKERIELLYNLSEAVRARSDALTEATVLEYGGPIEQARWRAGLAANNFLAAARLLEDFAFSRRINDTEVVAQAAGVALHIVPWNSVYNAISVKMAGALAAGCSVIVKPSEYSAWQTQLFTECLHAAGAPAGVINVVTGRGEVVGEALTSDPAIRKISFTGSTRVGKAIMAKAATHMTRLTLELGGKAPTIVMEDADLEKAASIALAAGFTNNGQACIAGTRILVKRSQMDAFCKALKTAVGTIVQGDPRDPRTTLGPLVNRQQYRRVQGYIRIGVEEGARLITGGEGRPDNMPRGYFAKPTVFADVTNTMTVAREEIFGPVLCVIAYEDEDHAVEIANDTEFGLHAYVLGEDVERARALAGRIDAGRVAINGVMHEPLAPFGGFKESGIGREYGVYGIEDHLELKAVMNPHGGS